MTILVTGATGRVGRHVVQQLVERGAAARVLVRDPSKADFPAARRGRPRRHARHRRPCVGPSPGRAPFSCSMRWRATNSPRRSSLLNIAREAGVERVVYLSVIHAERFVNVPHFAVKSGAERMIEQMGFSATILRPAYFIDNELMIKDVILNYGVYPMPIGGKGVAMIDARDIAEVAAIELIRRDQAPGKLPIETFNLVGPDTLTGADAGRHLVRRPRPPGRLRRRRSHRLRTEPGQPHAVLDGLRDAPDGRAFRQRRNGPGGRRRRAPDHRLLGRPLHTYRDFAAGLAA